MKLSDKTKRLLSTLALVLAGVAIGYAIFGGQGAASQSGDAGTTGAAGAGTTDVILSEGDTAGSTGAAGATAGSSDASGDVTLSGGDEVAGVEGSSQGTDASTSDSTSTSGTSTSTDAVRSATSDDGKITVYEDRTYSSRDKVALYIHAFGHLPANYITKDEAEALGWTGGSLEPYAPGCSIGGDWFGNYQGLLPSKRGREWHECDIGTQGKSSRGAKRIVYSNDGLIYYTSDHYESFTQLY